MQLFNSTKIHEINIWNKSNKSIQSKYRNKCLNNILFSQYYLYNIEKIYNGKTIKRELSIDRVICGTHILNEIIKISK